MWVPLVPFIVAATFQMLSLDWLGRGRGAGSWPDVLAWQRSQQLERLTDEYEALRAELPPEEFATLPPPEEHLEVATRAEYERNRAEVKQKEWALALVEVASAAGLFSLLLIPWRSPCAAMEPHHGD
jgi:hypothetical protein